MNESKSFARHRGEPSGSAVVARRRCVESAVSFTGLDRLARFVEGLSAAGGSGWPRLLGLADSPLEPLVGCCGVSRIHFGNEFCERLLASPEAVASVIALATEAGCAFALVLPMLTDEGIARSDRLLGALPENTEVVVNDWGLMHRMRRRFPGLKPTAGRLLCKMLKEPRAPSAAYLELAGHDFMTPGLETLLERLGASRVEMDVPPFARAEYLCAPGKQVSAHAPFGFATTGRICRVGSLHQPPARKFATGHNCARECLGYVTAMTPAGGPDHAQVHLFQRGNTIFYRHTAAMSAALAAAIDAGTVDRVVVPGDWNETGSSHLGG